MLFEYKPLLLSDKVENCLIYKKKQICFRGTSVLKTMEKNLISVRNRKITNLSSDYPYIDKGMYSDTQLK